MAPRLQSRSAMTSSASLAPVAAAARPRHRDRLVAEHVEVVGRIARRLARRCPTSVALEDLVAAGLLGLAEAAARYDDRRREPFLAFAAPRIRGAMLDELRRGDIMPRRVRQSARRVAATIRAVEQRHGGAASDERVAEALGVPVDVYRERLARLVDVTIGTLDDVDVPAADRSPAGDAERRQLLSRVHAALGGLPPRAVRVLSLHYGEERAYSEIAAELGVTVARVCQLHGRAIARLRAAVDEPAAVRRAA